MKQGIRFRVTALATLLVAVVLVATAVALLASQRKILTENLEETLSATANDLAQLQAGHQLPVSVPPRGDDDAIAQVVGTDGTILSTTPNYAGFPPLPAPAGVGPELRTTALFPGEPDYRLLSQRSGEVVIHTGAPIDDIADSVSILRVGLTIAVPVVIVILACLMWWLVGRTLRPVEAIRREVADISGQSLHRRVTEPQADDEIRLLARTMNDMLDRLQGAAERQQRFVADASHELRSPLARIRTELEVDAHHSETADLVASHASVLDETRHLERLVDDLLILARHDAHQTSATLHHLVDLDDIVFDEARRLRDTATVGVDTSTVSAAQVIGERAQLTRVVRNVLDNAARYAATTVSLSLAGRNGTARLTVDDDGPGIGPADHDRVFERFTRLDPSRTHLDRRASNGRASNGRANGGQPTNPTSGTGLGLAIARDIISAHGGSITIDPAVFGGARFVIELPLAPDGSTPGGSNELDT